MSKTPSTETQLREARRQLKNYREHCAKVEQRLRDVLAQRDEYARELVREKRNVDRLTALAQLVKP